MHAKICAALYSYHCLLKADQAWLRQKRSLWGLRIEWGGSWWGDAGLSWLVERGMCVPGPQCIFPFLCPFSLATECQTLLGRRHSKCVDVKNSGAYFLTYRTRQRFLGLFFLFYFFCFSFCDGCCDCSGTSLPLNFWALEKFGVIVRQLG